MYRFKDGTVIWYGVQASTASPWFMVVSVYGIPTLQCLAHGVVNLILWWLKGFYSAVPGFMGAVSAIYSHYYYDILVYSVFQVTVCRQERNPHHKPGTACI